MKKINQKGFSILEVSMAMGVIAIGILGVFSLIMQNVQVQKVNKNTLVASMLAQEGLELVRNLRDENWIMSGSDWDTDISGYTGNDFAIDYSMVIPADVDGINAAGAKLYQDVSEFYTHTATDNSDTPYYRLITVTPSGSPADYYKIKSEVIWYDNGVAKDYIAETYLYDWR